METRNVKIKDWSGKCTVRLVSLGFKPDETIVLTSTEFVMIIEKVLGSDMAVMIDEEPEDHTVLWVDTRDTPFKHIQDEKDQT